MTRALRWAVGAVGGAVMLLGAVLLASRQVGRPLDVVWWTAGAIALHDGVVAPVVLGIGALIPPGVRPRVRGALVVGACLTAVALPVLVRPGRPANPSVLPLDYGRNLAIALGAVVVVTGVRELVRRVRGRRRG